MPMLNAENSQNVLYFQSCHISYRQILPIFFSPWMLLLRLFSRHPLFFCDHLIELSFVFGPTKFEMCIPYSRTTTGRWWFEISALFFHPYIKIGGN